MKYLIPGLNPSNIIESFILNKDKITVYYLDGTKKEFLNSKDMYESIINTMEKQGLLFLEKFNIEEEIKKIQSYLPILESKELKRLKEGFEKYQNKNYLIALINSCYTVGAVSLGIMYTSPFLYYSGLVLGIIALKLYINVLLRKNTIKEKVKKQDYLINQEENKIKELKEYYKKYKMFFENNDHAVCINELDNLSKNDFERKLKKS